MRHVYTLAAAALIVSAGQLLPAYAADTILVPAAAAAAPAPAPAPTTAPAPGPAAAAAPIAAPGGGTTHGQPVQVVAGNGILLRLPRPMATIMSANPGVARVQPASPESLFLMGVGQGNTTVIATDASGMAIVQYDVTVAPAAGHLGGGSPSKRRREAGSPRRRRALHRHPSARRSRDRRTCGCGRRATT